MDQPNNKKSQPSNCWIKLQRERKENLSKKLEMALFMLFTSVGGTFFNYNDICISYDQIFI